MANLETLELTINGSATSASEGISQLITSLSSLSDALTKPYSDLRDFNAALKETASIAKSIKMTNVGNVKGAVSKSAKKALEPYNPKGVNVDGSRRWRKKKGDKNYFFFFRLFSSSSISSRNE